MDGNLESDHVPIQEAARIRVLARLRRQYLLANQ